MDHPLSTMQINKEMKTPLKSSCDRRQKKTTQKNFASFVNAGPQRIQLERSWLRVIDFALADRLVAQQG
jgi:hypothetical protein